MAWTNMTIPVVGEATKKVAFAEAVINNLVYLRANMGGSGGGGNLCVNGDFELDNDSDGFPDGWDLTEYTPGCFAIDETTPAQGARGIMFTSPGASGGGDVQSTDFFPVGPERPLCVDFIHWASVAGIRDLVEIRWYSTALEAHYITTATVYDSITNPTSKTRTIGYATPPSGARFAKLKLIGAQTYLDTPPGVAYFDAVKITESTQGSVVGDTSGAITVEGNIASLYIDGASSSPSVVVPGINAAKIGIAGGRSVDITLRDVGGNIRGTISLTLSAGIWTIFAGAQWKDYDALGPYNGAYSMTAMAIRTA